ncbi:MAG TPA: SLOG family protein [Blastocatellia bacterium]|nr:SLOG family protein [Blastocatellia bacterium]
MKVIIAGSRDITDYEVVKRAIEESGFEITEVVSGTAAGVDQLGEWWAELRAVPIARFPADWMNYGMRADAIRNAQMAE